MSGGFFNNVNQINMNAGSSSSTDWRLTLSDEERKANVSRLFKLLELAMLHLSPNQRFLTSKKCEDDAYNKATSKEEYQQAIVLRMNQFKIRAAQTVQQHQQNQQTAAVQ